MNKILVKSVKILLVELFLIAFANIFAIIRRKNYLQKFKASGELINPIIIAINITNLDQYNHKIISNINPYGLIIQR